MKRFLTVALLWALGGMAWAGQGDDVKKAEERLAASPDDPAANLTLGVWNAQRGKWDVALPYLAKVKSEGVRAACEAEKKADGNQFTSIEIGDAWSKAMPKTGPLRLVCFDRMNVHYAAAWPKLDDFGKTSLRDRLAKLYAPQAPGRAGGELAGWGGVDGAAAKIEVVGQRVRSGGLALKFSPKDKTKGTLAHSKALPVSPGKKLEVSAWVLSDGTDSIDSVTFVVRDNKNGFSWTAGGNVQPDFPVWAHVMGETVVPDGSLSVEVQIAFNSKAGAMFVDNLSIRFDGKELMPLGLTE